MIQLGSKYELNIQSELLVFPFFEPVNSCYCGICYVDYSVHVKVYMGLYFDSPSINIQASLTISASVVKNIMEFC